MVSKSRKIRLSAEQVRRFACEYTNLFRTPKYRAMAKRLDVPAFHQGCCQMVARSLKSVLGGRIYAVAVLLRGVGSEGWSLDHYLLRVGDFFIDNTGAYSLADYELKARREYRLWALPEEVRIAPVRSKWPGEGLWEGAHIFDQDVYDRLRRDAEAILRQIIN